MYVEEDGANLSIQNGLIESLCQLEEYKLSSDTAQRILDMEFERSQGATYFDSVEGTSSSHPTRRVANLMRE